MVGAIGGPGRAGDGRGAELAGGGGSAAGSAKPLPPVVPAATPCPHPLLSLAARAAGPAGLPPGPPSPLPSAATAAAAAADVPARRRTGSFLPPVPQASTAQVVVPDLSGLKGERRCFCLRAQGAEPLALRCTHRPAPLPCCPPRSHGGGRRQRRPRDVHGRRAAGRGHGPDQADGCPAGLRCGGQSAAGGGRRRGTEAGGACIEELPHHTRRLHRPRRSRPCDRATRARPRARARAARDGCTRLSLAAGCQVAFVHRARIRTSRGAPIERAHALALPLPDRPGCPAAMRTGTRGLRPRTGAALLAAALVAAAALPGVQARLRRSGLDRGRGRGRPPRARGAAARRHRGCAARRAGVPGATSPAAATPLCRPAPTWTSSGRSGGAWATSRRAGGLGVGAATVPPRCRRRARPAAAAEWG